MPYLRPSFASLLIASCAASYCASPRLGTYRWVSSHTSNTGFFSRSSRFCQSFTENSVLAIAELAAPATSLGTPDKSTIRIGLLSPMNCLTILGSGSTLPPQLCIMNANLPSMQSETTFRKTLLKPSWSFWFWLVGLCLLTAPTKPSSSNVPFRFPKLSRFSGFPRIYGIGESTLISCGETPIF